MRRTAGVLGVVILVLALGGCSGSKPAAFTSPREATTQPAPDSDDERPESSFTLGSVTLQAPDGTVSLPEPVQQGVKRALDLYVEKGVVGALRNGTAEGDLSDVFTSAALARVAGQDRAALVDEGMPRARRIKVESATADLDGLGVSADEVAIVVASIGLKVTASIDGTPLTLERTGQFELNPDGDSWKISGFYVKASRNTPETGTTVVGTRP